MAVVVCCDDDDQRMLGGRDGKKEKERDYFLPLLHDTPARPRTLSWQH